MTRDEQRWFLMELLRTRKDRRYRSGLLQGAVSFGVISQKEWKSLVSKIRDVTPILKGVNDKIQS